MSSCGMKHFVQRNYSIARLSRKILAKSRTCTVEHVENDTKASVHTYQFQLDITLIKMNSFYFCYKRYALRFMMDIIYF